MGSQYLGGDENGGILLPLDSPDVPHWFRLIYYFLGLIWSFMGVGIIADKFMLAIEVITAAEKEVTMPDGAKITVQVWNGTVANLTLMALGSSAPEILLSVIEIVAGKFYSGALGPSTIVGSAAFNLLIIIAVCVTALPEGETRKIDDMDVFKITAFFSVFAYLWLIVILMGITPDVVDVWEALLTFLFFPILVTLAYMADRKMFGARVGPKEHIITVAGKAFQPYMAGEYIKKLNPNMSTEEQAKVISEMAESNVKPSRAQLRMNAIRQMTGSKPIVKVKKKGEPYKLSPDVAAKAESEVVVDPTQEIYFEVADYACLESEGKIELTIARSAGEGTVTIGYHTEDITATAGKDYKFTEGTVTFQPDETKKTFVVDIIDDDEVEEDERFSAILKADTLQGSIKCRVRDGGEKCTVTIIDDDEPGDIGFKPEQTAVNVSETDGVCYVNVSRVNGAQGTLECKVELIDMEAIAGTDYDPSSVEDTLRFDPHQNSKQLELKIIDTKKYEKKAKLKVKLSEAGLIIDGEKVGVGDRVKMMEYTECIVTIHADEKTRKLYDEVTALVNQRVGSYKVGTSTWAQQFKEALQMDLEEEDEDYKPGKVDYFMHALNLPWKLFFALVPPTDFQGGYTCFFVALLFIGITTAFIGDLAAIFGCLLGISDGVTAITFVALGTSLPDTFASKSAAQCDDNADASVGNVTGSNSVNVFLGLGLPWLIAALYWNGAKATDEWKSFYKGVEMGNGELITEAYPDGGFVVISGSLGFSVIIFCICAMLCLGTLYYRRVTYDCELGGPAGPAKKHAMFFVGLWFFYIVMSILSSGDNPVISL